MLNRNDNGEAAAAFYAKRQKWMDFISEHGRVSHAGFRVGYWLARRMNGKDQCCWWSVPEIAKQIGCSTKTVSTATTELETLGLMIIVRKKGKGNTYHIRLPFD